MIDPTILSCLGTIKDFGDLERVVREHPAPDARMGECAVGNWVDRIEERLDAEGVLGEVDHDDVFRDGVEDRAGSGGLSDERSEEGGSSMIVNTGSESQASEDLIFDVAALRVTNESIGARGV